MRSAVLRVTRKLTQSWLTPASMVGWFIGRLPWLMIDHDASQHCTRTLFETREDTMCVCYVQWFFKKFTTALMVLLRTFPTGMLGSFGILENLTAAVRDPRLVLVGQATPADGWVPPSDHTQATVWVNKHTKLDHQHHQRPINGEKRTYMLWHVWLGYFLEGAPQEPEFVNVDGMPWRANGAYHQSSFELSYGSN